MRRFLREIPWLRRRTAGGRRRVAIDPIAARVFSWSCGDFQFGPGSDWPGGDWRIQSGALEEAAVIHGRLLENWAQARGRNRTERLARNGWKASEEKRELATCGAPDRAIRVHPGRVAGRAEKRCWPKGGKRSSFRTRRIELYQRTGGSKEEGRRPPRRKEFREAFRSQPSVFHVRPAASEARERTGNRRGHLARYGAMP